MSVETLCSRSEELPDQLKKPNPLLNAAIEFQFGKPLEAVKAPNPDLLIPKSEVGTVKIINPRIVELKTIPQGAKSEPSQQTKVEIKDLPVVKEVTGKQLAFNVGLYRKLYNEILEATGGDEELAGVDTYRAVLRDGTSFIQESITAQKNEKGELEIQDKVFQAKLQQTATVHSFLQIQDHETGKSIITSPEYLQTGRSITTAITGWRRGNDHAAISLVEKLVDTLPNDPASEGYTLMWASPKAEDWEDEWVRKYNKEYGYQYVGRLEGPAGKRRLVVHSYKADAETETFDKFMGAHKGEVYQAAFEDQKERPFLDHLMRSVKVIKGSISGTEVISGLYKAKREVEDSDRMFGILENTMHFVQDENLRQRIEWETSSPVAHWIVDQIKSEATDGQIQEEVVSRFIDETKALEKRIQEEEKAAIKVRSQRLIDYPVYRLDSNPFSDDTAFLMADLQRRTQTAGAFCGEIGESSSVSFGSNPIQDIISNYTGMSDGRINSIGRGGLSSGEVSHCKKCGEEICESKCFKCKIQY